MFLTSIFKMCTANNSKKECRTGWDSARLSLRHSRVGRVWSKIEWDTGLDLAELRIAGFTG